MRIALVFLVGETRAMRIFMLVSIIPRSVGSLRCQAGFRAVPLYSLYDFDNVYGFIQTTSKVSQDEWVKIDASIFGTQLKNLRVKKGMTILDLEIASGISSSNISNYENAQKDFKLNTYNKLAQGLEVQHVELMFDPSNPILLHSIGI